MYKNNSDNANRNDDSQISDRVMLNVVQYNYMFQRKRNNHLLRQKKNTEKIMQNNNDVKINVLTAD